MLRLKNKLSKKINNALLMGRGWVLIATPIIFTAYCLTEKRPFLSIAAGLLCWLGIPRKVPNHPKGGDASGKTKGK